MSLRGEENKLACNCLCLNQGAKPEKSIYPRGIHPQGLLKQFIACNGKGRQNEQSLEENFLS